MKEEHRQDRINAETVLILETCYEDHVIFEKNPRLKKNVLDAMESYAEQYKSL